MRISFFTQIENHGVKSNTNDSNLTNDIHALGEMNVALVGWKILWLAILKASFQSGRPQNLSKAHCFSSEPIHFTATQKIP